MPILAALLMIFLGGVGQSFVLEYMVKIDPSSGSTITFFQFLVVALTALHDYLTYTRPDGTYVATNGCGRARRRKRRSHERPPWWPVHCATPGRPPRSRSGCATCGSSRATSPSSTTPVRTCSPRGVAPTLAMLTALGGSGRSRDLHRVRGPVVAGGHPVVGGVQLPHLGAVPHGLQELHPAGEHGHRHRDPAQAVRPLPPWAPGCDAALPSSTR